MGIGVSEPKSVFLNRVAGNSARTHEKLEGQIAELESRVKEALLSSVDTPTGDCAKPDSIEIWGVPFSRLSLADTLVYADQLIRQRDPGYFITANLNYLMLTHRHEQLPRVNRDARFIVCDGMPMVWRSRFTGRPLPMRVAGSELIYAMSQWAAAKGHRVFFLGGAPGIAQAAADTLARRYPRLQVAGVESPPFRPLADEEHQDLIDRIRAAKPDILYLAYGQPKGELWLAENYRELGVPLCVQIGASFDFVAGDVARAPKWMQLAGLEWLYRLAQEPRRLTGRYASNAGFLLQMLGRDLMRRQQKSEH